MLTRTLLTRTLDDELLGVLRGEDDACLACGETVEAQTGRVECSACGSVLAGEVRPSEEQRALV